MTWNSNSENIYFVCSKFLAENNDTVPSFCVYCTSTITQVQLEHTDVQEDAAAWDVDIDHTFTPRCDGSGVVLVVATITGMLLEHSAAHFALYYYKSKCIVCVADCRCRIQICMYVCMYVCIIIIIIIIIETSYHACSDACLRVEGNILQHFKLLPAVRWNKSMTQLTPDLFSGDRWAAPISRNIRDQGWRIGKRKGKC